MTNKQKIEALEKGIKSSVTPENLKEKMRTQLAQLKALEKESTSDKKPQNKTSNEDVLAVLYNADSKGWNATKAESGGDIKASDELTEKYANAVSKAIKEIKKGSLSEEIFDELTEGNNHLLNEFLVWNGYYNSETTATNKASYQRVWDKGNRQVANPKVITLGVKTPKPSSATPIKKASKNYYRNKEVKSVTVLENGKKVTYAGKDVLNGANFFKEGGVLTSKATYIPVRNIVEVTFEDGSKDKPRNGYHIKNGATPIVGTNYKSPDDLEKELHRLQRELNSKRLSTYKEGDNSKEEKERIEERNQKLKRFNEVLAELKSQNSKFEFGGVVNYEKGKTYPVKKVSVAEGEKIGLDGFPNFHKSGSISGMKKQYYGKDALLIQSGNYIYNVTSEPEIYFRYEHGGEVWQPVVQLVPLELEPLSSQLKAYTGNALSVDNYTNEEGKEYSTAPGEIIVHKESGRKFEIPEKIYDYVDGFNLVFDKRNNKIVTWEEGKIVAEIKDGNLDFTNKDESISINKSKVESEFEKGFIPEKTNEKWAYIAVENKLQKLYAIAEDLEDDKTSAAWKTNQEKIKKFEDYLHRLERKYEVGGPVELPEGSLQHFENYYLEKGGKVDKEYSLIGTKVTSDIRKQSGYVTGYNGNYVDVYYPSLEFGESVLYKGKDQQNVMVVMDKPSLILNSVLKEDEFDNYFIEEIVEESTPIDEYEVKDSSSLIVLLRPKVSYKNDVFFGPIALIVTQKGFVYKIDNATFDKWDEIVKDAETDKLTDDKYGYVKIGNFLKEEYKLGGALLSAWKRERKYVNKSEDYEVRYAKGKNRSGYKKYEDGGEVGDYAKVPVGYNMTHYGLIKKVITNDVLYPENGYEIAGIGDILHPEQFEVISSAEFNKLKKQGTEVKPNHFLIIEEEFEKGGKLDNRIKLVVVNEHTLGYIDPRTPNTFNILHASVLKGSSYQNLSAPSIPKNGKIRLATPKDFDDFRVDFTGYDNEEEYIYDSGKKSKFEKGGVLSKDDEVKHKVTKKHGKVISVKELNGLEDEVVVEFEDGTTETLNSFDVEKVLEIKAKKTYDPSSGLTLEEWKAKHNIQNYGKGGEIEQTQFVLFKNQKDLKTIQNVLEEYDGYTNERDRIRNSGKIYYNVDGNKMILFSNTSVDMIMDLSPRYGVEPEKFSKETNYKKGGKTGVGKGAIFAIAKEIRKPGEKWQDAVARAGKLNK